MDHYIELAQEFWENVQDDYWRSQHREELILLGFLVLSVVEIPLAYCKARAYKAGRGK